MDHTTKSRTGSAARTFDRVLEDCAKPSRSTWSRAYGKRDLRPIREVVRVGSRIEYLASRQDSAIELPIEAGKKAWSNIICEYEFSSHWHSFHAETDHALQAFQAALKSQGLDLEILECSIKKLDRVGVQAENITFIKSIIAGSCRHFWALGISEDPVHSALIAFHKSANLIVC